MARPRRQTYTMSQYLDNVKEGYISNDADTQRNPAWKPIVDGLAVTILTDDYIPALILAEEDSGQIHIVDGGSRTTAFIMLRFGNYKVKSSVEDPIIQYKSATKDENGKMVWVDATFDIRNKTFEQFPKELQKKFDEYQVETVIHECDTDKISKYLRRYNVHTQMNANQKMFIYLPKFAGKIREIINKPFFVDYSSFTDTEKEKGKLERVISESVMCMFHFDKWSKGGKNIAVYLNENAALEEFVKVENNLTRLEQIISDETKTVFTSKDTFIWLTLFDKFVELGVDDIKFNDFIKAFIDGLRNKKVDDKLFDEADETGSTKDKKVIVEKLHILETLMMDFLHIKKEDTEEVDTLDFVRDNVKPDATEEDVAFYSDVLDDLTLEVDNNTKLLDKHNQPSLIALVGYACENDEDEKLSSWIKKWFATNIMYTLNQKRNFNIMLNDFQKGAVA